MSTNSHLPEDEAPQSRPVRGPGKVGWHPDLNPVQREIFNDTAQHILGYGEKGSGKSIGFGHKIVRHCYENENAFQIVITPSIFTGSEGMWQDLETLILPQWREGIGLDFRESRLDPQTKDKVIWIGNRFGGWSKMVLKSIPYEGAVEARIKGPAPSGIYVDELTDCEGPGYFRYTSAQLGRRRGIKGPQQFLASCNPKGPSHWVYKTFFQDCIDEKTGQRAKSFSVYHVPIQENIHRLPPGYYDRLKAIFSSDTVEMRRLMHGEWVDRPSGDAIFKEQFSEDIHVRPLPRAGQKGGGIIPLAEYPITIGYDPGTRNFSIHFLQAIPMSDKMVWTVFDERNHVGTGDSYRKIIFGLMDRMFFWQRRLGKKLNFEHISDEAAFSHQNSRGSFDARDIEEISREYIQKNPNCELDPIRMRPCPKGPESVPARVRMIQSLLMDGTLLISAICSKTREMFLNMTSKKVKVGEYDSNAGFIPQKGVYKHAFDSLSYPILFYQAMPRRRFPNTGDVGPSVFFGG
jgi:hypothetical protein